MTIKIRSLRTSAGFLKNAPIEIADGLTCVIGARGTCKSTVVETIRFAFDCDRERVDRVLLAETARDATGDTPPQSGLIRATLEDGSVCCEIDEAGASDTFRLTIERDVRSRPRVYREGIKELSDAAVLDQIEIYSQGDLQRFAESDTLRLELIDRPNKAAIAQFKKQRKDQTDILHELGPNLRAKRGEIEARQSKVQGLDQLRSQLASMQSERPALSEELDREREAFLARKSLLERAQASITARAETLTALRAAADGLPELDGLPTDLRGTALADAQVLAERLEEAGHFVAKIGRDLTAAEAVDMPALFEALRDELESRNENYYRLRQTQQAVNESLKREDTIKQQILQIEKLEKELERLTSEEQELVRKRKSMRETVQRLNDQIYRLRLNEVEQINAQHCQVVLLSLEQGARSHDYKELLARLLQGSRLRHQEDVVKDISEKIRPPDLVDMVESGDSQRLAAVLIRDLGQMARLVSFLLDNQDLYLLEGVVFDDRLEITLYDGEVPKPVSQLSKGQIATAMLPLILRPAGYPIVFDQPEDDLDNSFIYSTLVEHIRQLKTHRQLIFVTHNANIPVLGEAD